MAKEAKQGKTQRKRIESRYTVAEVREDGSLMPVDTGDAVSNLMEAKRWIKNEGEQNATYQPIQLKGKPIRVTFEEVRNAKLVESE